MILIGRGACPYSDPVIKVDPGDIIVVETQTSLKE